MLGGREGLRRMRENAKLMLILAAHAQQWNFDEGVIVTERMRRDAVRLRSCSSAASSWRSPSISSCGAPRP